MQGHSKMNWFFYSLLCAFSVASADALSKMAMNRSLPHLITWVRVCYSIPFLLLLVPFTDIPKLDLTFFLIVCVLLPLDLTAIFLYVKAINLSPLSLTLPFLALTPVFLMCSSYFFLGELPEKKAFIGILLVALGAYLLNIKSTSKGLLEPFRAIFREKGSVLMIVVAFIFSITTCLGKIAINHSSVIFFGIFYPVAAALIITPILLFKFKAHISKLFSRPVLFALIGFAMALMIVCHFKAVSLIDVSYMISVKRTSLIFGVIYGAILFKETNIRERLLGSCVMTSGVVLISLP